MVSQHQKIKTFIGGVLLLCLFSAALFIFWDQQARFLRPTPKPTDFQEVSLGVKPDLSSYEIQVENGKLSLLHFFNPDCPCSRFNLDHFKSLVRKYADTVNFVVVLQTKEANPEDIAAFSNIKVLVDQDGSIADRCGVYATPQAVVLDKAGKIVYRGNYNQARYCSNRDSWFTELVIKSEMGLGDKPFLPALAFTPYGCNLPSDQAIENNNSFLGETLRQLIK